MSERTTSLEHAEKIMRCSECSDSPTGRKDKSCHECYHNWTDWPAAGSVEARAISHIMDRLRESFKERFVVNGTMEKAKQQGKVTLLESIIQPCLENGCEDLHKASMQLLGIPKSTLNLGLKLVDEKTMEELDAALIDGSNVQRALKSNAYDTTIIVDFFHLPGTGPFKHQLSQHSQFVTPDKKLKFEYDNKKVEFPRYTGNFYRVNCQMLKRLATTDEMIDEYFESDVHKA
jgi:hypothetical protein